VSGRLPRDIDGRELVRALERTGFVVDRQSGSHAVLIDCDGREVVVPIHRDGLSLPARYVRSCDAFGSLPRNYPNSCRRWSGASGRSKAGGTGDKIRTRNLRITSALL